MTPQIAITYAVLGVAVLLFITEKVRPDLVALMVLLALVLTQIVTPEQALAGFSSTAVIVVWAMFIISAGLRRTGLSASIGTVLASFAGRGEPRLLFVLIITAGLISGFTGMNNIAATALLLPVVFEISRRAKRPASRLLLPMLYGVLIGGMSLLIASPTNLLVNQALLSLGQPGLGMFAFTPAALVFLVAAALWITLFGRRLLPARVIPRALTAADAPAAFQQDHRSLFGLEERLALLSLPPGSPLAGKSLAESRIGQALGLTILSIHRRSGEHLPPEPDEKFHEQDQLLVLGRLDHLQELLARPTFDVVDDPVTMTRILSAQVGLAEFKITPDSEFNGRSLVEVSFRQNYGVSVLAIQREQVTRRANLQDMILAPDDNLLLIGTLTRLEGLHSQPGFRRLGKDEARAYQIDERLLYIRIPDDSALAGRTLEESRLGSVYGLVALSVIRSGQESLLPEPTVKLEVGDLLVVEGRPSDIEVVRGLRSLAIESNVHIDLAALEEDSMAMVEVVLSPYTNMLGKTLREVHFRQKYGLSVLAIWRGDRPYRTDLANMPLRSGDAFLCYGPITRFAILAREPDFIVLRSGVQEEPRRTRALAAGLILGGVILTTLLNWLPITVAALSGAVLMVLVGCLTMEEAYQAIEWKAVFLIAGMLPLGIAMEQTGAATLLADRVSGWLGGGGPQIMLGSLFLLTLLATQFIPNPVVAVLMAPVALTLAASQGAQPHAFLLTVAYAASCSFLTPVGHPANLLVMSAGGYRLRDYMVAGLPVAIIGLLVSIFLLPRLFPF